MVLMANGFWLGRYAVHTGWVLIHMESQIGYISERSNTLMELVLHCFFA